MYSTELESAADKLAWAEDQILVFQGQLRRFADSKPYRSFVEKDATTGEQVFKVRLSRPMPREMKHVSAGVVGNLRSALDQAAFATAIAAGKTGKFAAFPFAKSAADMAEARRSRSKDVPADAFAVMASFKPYRGGNDALWALNELCNADKHRTTFAAITRSGGVHYEKIEVVGGGMSIGNPSWDRARNELELLRCGQGAKIDFNANVALYVAFGGVEVVDGQPVEPYLLGMAKEVSAILAAVDAEAKRINLFK